MKKPKIKKLKLEKIKIAKLDTMSNIRGGRGIISYDPTCDDCDDDETISGVVCPTNFCRTIIFCIRPRR